MPFGKRSFYIERMGRPANLQSNTCKVSKLEYMGSVYSNLLTIHMQVYIKCRHSYIVCMVFKSIVCTCEYTYAGIPMYIYVYSSMSVKSTIL